MDHKSRHHKKKKVPRILLVLFLVLFIWAIYGAYKYFTEIPIVELTHPLFVNIVTDKNLTMQEVIRDNAYNETETKYVIMPLGGVYFYSLSPGLNLTREVEINNMRDYPVGIQTSINGNISNFITAEFSTINEADPVLMPYSNETIILTLRVPTENVLAGKYNGNLTIRLTPKET